MNYTDRAKMGEGCRRALLLCLIFSAMAIYAEAAYSESFSYLFSFGRPAPRTDNSFNYPSGVAVDQGTGDLFVMDQWGQRVVRYDSNGNYVQDWLSIGGLGVGVDSARGVVYVAVPSKNLVRRYTLNGLLIEEWGASGSGQTFARPRDVAIDESSGKVYVLNGTGRRIDVLGTDGTEVLSWTGDWAAPYGIALDENNSLLYVADSGQTEIEKWSVSGTLIGIWGEKGSEPGEFRWPRGVAVGSQGRVYVADTDNERVQILSGAGELVNIINQPHSVASGPLHPRAVAVDRARGVFYVAAAYAHRIYKYDLDGKLLSTLGSHESDRDVFNEPKGIAADELSGDIFVADTGHHVVKRFSADGGYIGVVGGRASVSRNEYSIDWPKAVHVDRDGSVWVVPGGVVDYVELEWRSTMYPRRFSPSGQFIMGISNTLLAKNIGGIATSGKPLEKVMVANTERNELVLFGPWGVVEKQISGVDAPAGVSYDSSSDTWVVLDTKNNFVYRLSSGGNVLDSWGGAGAAPGELKLASFSGLDVDDVGRIFVADTQNNRVQVFSGSGALLGVLNGSDGAGPSRFGRPADIAVSGGRLYVLEGSSDQVDVFQIQ